jgi:hypothetical protein
MRPREVSSLFLSPTLPCLLAPAGYASSLAAGFCAAFANPQGGLRPAASAPLELHRRRRVGLGAHSGRQFLRENVDGMDLGGSVEQFLGPAEQGGGDRALKMRLPRRVAAEAVKDSKRSLIDPEGVPGDRSGLLGDETLGACKKCGDLFFLPRLCLQRNRQGDFLH